MASSRAMIRPGETPDTNTAANGTSSYSLPAKGIWQGDWATDAKLKLVSDSYINFISVPKILDFAKRESLASMALDAGASTEVMQYAHKISRLYRKRLGEYISAAESAATASELDAATFQQTQDIPQAREMRSILHLAETFYLPADGLGDGVVGEALTHWLNHSRPGPSNEIAEDFMSAATPYYNQEFLPFINKCILRGYFTIAQTLLSKFDDHHPIVQQLASETAQLISTIPRSPAFNDARKFLIKRHEWTERVKVLQSSLQAEFDEFEADRARDGNETDGDDERLDLEVGFMILLGTLAGDSERILEASESWQEALGAWGLLVQPSLTREDVPVIVTTIFERCAVTADPADEVQAALVRGEPAQAALLTRNVDPWLAAHLIDLFDRVDLLLPIGEADTISDLPPNLRNDATRAYAEMILEDQGLWRVAIDYFALAGREGQQRLREVLLTVPLTDEEEEAMAAPFGSQGGKGKGKGKDRSQLHGQGLQHKIRDATKAHQQTMKRIRALNASTTGGTVWGGAEDCEEEGLDDENDELETVTRDTLDHNVLAARRERKRRRQERERELAARSIEVQRVEDVLEVCQEHGLDLEARAVCLKMADAMLRQKRYSVALEYSARAQDERHIGRIADFLIDQYTVLDRASWLELIDKIPRSLLRGNATAPGPPGAAVGDEEEEEEYDEDFDMTVDGMEMDRRSEERDRKPGRLAFGQGVPVDSPRLRFLAKYRDFHRLYNAREFRAAASVLVEVLQGRLAPERFWALILIDASPLLESEIPFFDTDQTFELMRHVEKICSAARRNPIEAKLYFGTLTRIMNPSEESSSNPSNGLAGSLHDSDRLAILSAPAVDVDVAIQRMNVVRMLLTQQLCRNTV
ncbi:unnamed protein product [Tilletia laevis]|uniref:Nuclear pore complex protein Nup85 n=3 Tax=Tilletia TaxID=13289 RepID=A0ABN7IVX9_9BASI|nr:hypothetical protein CF336_g1659 [Tilletia laevis]CAD6891279.1 unnamed protein product [Tilletia caries]KAE8207393.1 hypothetical protein CF335_g1178 [Tilletia laevis]CAD6900807.1 unnamed protein product [Tilletia laevis]CAD6926138.1 unnamed protein product [Tilletia caries]